MNGKEKNISFCLICMAIILMGMIAFIDAMIEKFGMVAIPVYLFVWLVLVCVYIVCIQKLNNK
nr:MAG TPA: hypothetical protein [Caudoviricetes sp.]